MVVDGGALNGVPSFEYIESLAPSSSLVSGTVFEVIYSDYEWREELECAASLISGTVEEQFTVTYQVPPEEIAVGAELKSGTVIFKVNYTNWTPEELEVSAALLSGTVT